MVYVEQQGKLYYLRYYVEGTDDYVVVATTRPETIFGDTAMCINPNDPRYRHLHGKRVIVPIAGRSIPVIEDEYVDIEFGTGCLKVTPAHDVNDKMLGDKYGLEVIDIFNDDATLNQYGLHYQGMDRFAVRKAIEKELAEKGLLEKVEAYTNKVGTSERTKAVIEPKVSLQWFLKMEHLAKPALEAVMSDQIRFVPEKFKNTYRYWMENVHDWSISRQLWWGHRIPAYYYGAGANDFVVAETLNQAVEKARQKTGNPALQAADLTQDPDALDTWFSSWLWPMSVFDGVLHPDNPEIQYYYPTNDLVTAPDIIFFWVARMIFSAIEQTGEVPFHTVFIHGLVRDAQGRKMSKSLGNGIDPLEIIDQYGADALRLALVTGNSPGNDMRFSDDKIKAARNFANKLWNATRFILMNLSDEVTDCALPRTLSIEDKWVLSQYNRLVREVTENLDKFELGIAEQKLYDFLWDVLCDWYIELAKSRLQAGGETALCAQKVLVFLMSNTVKLLHPFMPFITEEIWQALPTDTESIMRSVWPAYDAELDFAEEEREFARIMEAIKAIRNTRTERMCRRPARQPFMLQRNMRRSLQIARRSLSGWHRPPAYLSKRNRRSRARFKSQRRVPVFSSRWTT